MATLKPLLVLFSLCLMFASASAYTTHMYVPAVLTNQNLGNLTLIILNVNGGTGNVSVTGPSSVEPDTLASAQTAARYAASFLGLNYSDYDFTYTIQNTNVSVSGPSGGLAFTLLAIAGLQQKQLATGFTATGTISSDGTVGLIGGVYDKTGAAEGSGLSFVLVPATPNDTLEALIYYIAQQTYGIPLVEVANVSQALPYALGLKGPNLFLLNFTQGYKIASLGDVNITCSNCDSSDFAVLVNFTMNYSTDYISSISSDFSYLKQSLLSNINSYRSIAGKGYLYTAADFTFLDFINAFTLVNSQNLSVDSAMTLLDNVSSYCSSLMPPPMTDLNYEFVVGGRLRQMWGNITISNAENTLSSEETSDDIIQSVHSAGAALGWCRAAYESYSIASAMGGDYVQTSLSLKNDAFNAISSAMNFGGIYLQTAEQAYASGDYATALYSATYANIFGPSNNLTLSELYSKTLQNINNATDGTWPSQFAAQAEFYFRQAVMSQGDIETNYANQAYSTSQLAVALESADDRIAGSFTFTNATSNGLTQQVLGEISAVENDLSQMYLILLLNAAMMFAILVILLFHLLSPQRREHRIMERRTEGRKKRR